MPGTYARAGRSRPIARELLQTSLRRPAQSARGTARWRSAPVSSATTAAAGRGLRARVDEPAHRVDRRRRASARLGRAPPTTSTTSPRGPRRPRSARRAPPPCRARPPRAASSARGRPRPGRSRVDARRAPRATRRRRRGDSNATSVSGAPNSRRRARPPCAAGSRRSASVSAGSAAGDERRQRRARPGQHLDREPGRDARLHEHEARVADQRHAGVADQRDDLARRASARRARGARARSLCSW